MKYQPTIGLEIHAELNTATKMFCACANDPEEKIPNTNVCPVCLAHPGALPTINKKAVAAVLRVGLALAGTIAPLTKFDRKNYFYPDLPKGYQISQYDQPLVSGGTLCGVRLARIHLEEDAGRLVHTANRETAGKNEGSTATLVDYNRAGVPLLELVTEPDMHSAGEAVNFARELQAILRALYASDADMEKGQMRLEANISLSEAADKRGSAADIRGRKLGTKVEVKNINSFRALSSAITYEIKRQSDILDRGEKVRMATRGWDDLAKKTVHQRFKEEAHDYRYFPEPDLPPFETAEFNPEDMRRHLPELPLAKRERFGREYGLTIPQIETLVADKSMADFFESALSELAARNNRPALDAGAARDILFNYLTSDLRGLLNETDQTMASVRVTPEHLAHLVDLLQAKKIGSRQAKDILRLMVETGEDPEEILEREGLHTVSIVSELAKVVAEVVAENPAAVQDYQSGKLASLKFLLGRAMSKLRGRGDPQALERMLTEKLR